MDKDLTQIEKEMQERLKKIEQMEKKYEHNLSQISRRDKETTLMKEGMKQKKGLVDLLEKNGIQNENDLQGFINNIQASPEAAKDAEKDIIIQNLQKRLNQVEQSVHDQKAGEVKTKFHAWLDEQIEMNKESLPLLNKFNSEKIKDDIIKDIEKQQQELGELPNVKNILDSYEDNYTKMKNKFLDTEGKEEAKTQTEQLKETEAKKDASSGEEVEETEEDAPEFPKEWLDITKEKYRMQKNKELVREKQSQVLNEKPKEVKETKAVDLRNPSDSEPKTKEGALEKFFGDNAD